MATHRNDKYIRYQKVLLDTRKTNKKLVQINQQLDKLNHLANNIEIPNSPSVPIDTEYINGLKHKYTGYNPNPLYIPVNTDTISISSIAHELDRKIYARPISETNPETNQEINQNPNTKFEDDTRWETEIVLVNISDQEPQ